MKIYRFVRYRKNHHSFIEIQTNKFILYSLRQLLIQSWKHFSYSLFGISISTSSHFCFIDSTEPYLVLRSGFFNQLDLHFKHFSSMNFIFNTKPNGTSLFNIRHFKNRKRAKSALTTTSSTYQTELWGNDTEGRGNIRKNRFSNYTTLKI